MPYPMAAVRGRVAAMVTAQEEYSYTPVIDPFLAGGVSAANCIGAYHPIGAADQASSYVNLANPGTYNLTATAAPTWNTGEGWIFNGTSQFLLTGVTPSSGNWSMVVKFSRGNLAGTDYQVIAGATNVSGGVKRYYVANHMYNAAHLMEFGIGSGGGGNGYLQYAPAVPGGVMTLAGTHAFFNGSILAGASSSNAGSTLGLYIGADNVDGTASYFFSGTIQAIGIYNTVLSDAQVLAISNALDGLLYNAIPYTAYIDTGGNDATAVLNDPAHPFLTINAALLVRPASVVTLRIGAGVFAATGEGNKTTSKMRNAVKFYGSGQPTIKADRTGLETGTIIKGPLIIDRSDIEIYDLGVDSGSAVCTADYGGTVQDGLAFVNIYPILQEVGKPAHTGNIVRRVTAIGKAYDALIHPFLFENCTNGIVDTLTTMYGFAGCVVKSIGATLSNIVCAAHRDGALYIKSSLYALAHNMTFTNVTVNSVVADDTVPIRFAVEDGVVNNLYDCSVTNVTNNTSKGIAFSASSGGTIDNCDVVDMTGVSTFTKSGTVTNCSVNGTPI